MLSFATRCARRTVRPQLPLGVPRHQPAVAVLGNHLHAWAWRNRARQRASTGSNSRFSAHDAHTALQTTTFGAVR